MKTPFLVGKHTYLRPVELSDTPLIQKWHNDPKVRRLARLGSLPVTYIQEADDIKMAKHSHDEIYFMIMNKSTDKPFGFIRLNYIDTASRNMWLRIIIGDAKARGKNLAKDALSQVLEGLFSEQNVHRVTLETYETNKRAIRFFEKLGFRREGTIREAVYLNGKHCDIISFGLLNREYKKV